MPSAVALSYDVRDDIGRDLRALAAAVELLAARQVALDSRLADLQARIERLEAEAAPHKGRTSKQEQKTK